MSIDFLLDVFSRAGERDALVWRDQTYHYAWLRDKVEDWRKQLAGQVTPGSVAALEADFSPNAVALFLALIDAGCILVPLTSSVAAKRDEFLEIGEVEVGFTIDGDDRIETHRYGRQAQHPVYQQLRAAGRPGLVVFSSGSTGKSKAAVHDLVPLLAKFHQPRHSLRTISFLLYDHIGGINTMLYTLSNAGCLVTVRERSPDAVLAAVERHRVELLPTSPTFLNLMLISEAYRRHSLDSLKTISYGTEPMPESTLQRLHALFPHIQLLQTYGLSEVGILRSKSRSSDSLWVKIGGEGFTTRISNGVLHIKAKSAMLGYLNAESPFTSDGWYNTGDRVEVDGEYVRFLGRDSEIINVGGEKVFPAEVESVIQELENVADAVVYGEKNPLTGQIVCARVSLRQNEERGPFVARLKAHCRERMQNYKVPVKVLLVDENAHAARFKKIRKAG